MVTRHLLLAALFVILASCASEDPSIVNPPPGNANVGVRFFNLVPDDQDRKLVMEQGYQTLSIPSGMFSAAVNAPADSSIVEILAGSTTEYRSPTRVRFTRQSVYDIIAVPSVADPSAFDTIMVSNANRSLTTVPVAQVRVINAVPDTSFTLDVRYGCPNGSAITSTPTKFKEASLYRELPPGLSVFSIQKVSPSGTTIIGTYECVLKEFTPYSILYYLGPGGSAPQLMLFEESDLTTGAERPLTPVLASNADVRVFNVGFSSVEVKIRKSGQVLASGLASENMSAYNLVPACEQQEPDVFEATFSDGSTATDSTSLTVRGRYTLITSDTGGIGTMVVVPPTGAVYGSAGLSVIRVVHAADRSGGVAVAVGARTDASQTNGYSSGTTLTQDISFGMISKPVILVPGETPITVTTSSAPTSMISIRTSMLEANRYYMLVLSTAPDGTLRTYLIDETDQPGLQQEIDRAVLLRFVNGTPINGSSISNVGTVVNNARVYYRNSLTTTIPTGGVSVSSGNASVTTTAVDGKRTLEIFTVHGSTDKIIDIVSDPLRQEAGISDRRVINATADIPLVSVAYDTNYKTNPDVPHVAKNVGFGEVSATHVLERDQRGSMYVYDSNTLAQLYTLPIDIGPLGNSYSLIVVGNKQSGYEVIVLQEF